MQIHTIIRHNLTIFSVELEKVGSEAILKKQSSLPRIWQSSAIYASPSLILFSYGLKNIFATKLNKRYLYIIFHSIMRHFSGLANKISFYKIGSD